MKIAIQNFTVIVEAMALHGLPAASQCLSERLAEQRAAHRDDWRTEDELDEFMCLAQTLSGDAGFGLVSGTSLAQAGLGTLAMLMAHAPSLRAMLDDALRYARLLLSRSELAYAVEGSRCVLSFRPLGKTADGIRFRTEQIMGGLMMLLRYCGAHDSDVGPVCIAHAPPAYAARYGPVFGPTVCFGQPRCEIAFDARLLDRQHAHRDSAAYLNLRARADAELAAILAADSVVQALQKLLLPPGSKPGTPPKSIAMSEAARQLRMSARTLRRHLAEAGTSYSAVRDGCRQLAGQQLLLAGEIPIKQIAETLGYATPSSMHRAFRRSTGMTPLQWQGAMRKGHLPGEAHSTD